MRSLVLLLIVLASCSNTSSREEPWPRGKLIIVGGGKISAEMLRRALEAAGGADARILIIPTASGAPEESAASAREMFEKVGARHFDILQLPDLSHRVQGASLIFFGGGDQNRLTAALLGTAELEAIRRRYREGAVVMGTSAGAAIMSDIMLTGEGDPEAISPAAGIAPGFGFLPRTIIDQHFVKRRRHNRLISVLLEHPDHLAIGIDESTAIWVSDGAFEVMGSGSVIVYDARQAKSGRGIRMDVLKTPEVRRVPRE